MAKPKLSIGERALKLRLKKKTSDGSSIMSRPRSKQAFIDAPHFELA
jgi:hypothetical protein